MANTIQHKRGSGTPAGGIARGELAIQEVAANYTTNSSSKLWIGEGSTPSLRQVGFGIYDGSTQSGIPIGGNLTFTGGTAITTTVSGAGVTHAVTAASIGDTQLAYNTGQHLTTTSAPTFATVNTGQGANELYDMNQNVKTDSAVTFATLEITGVAGSIDTEGSIYLTGDEKVVRWYEGNNYISLAAPSSVSENTDYLWPAADGTGGYQLTTDGSGNLSWAASGGTVNTADIADVSVTQTELAELETLGSTSISSTNWTALSNLTGTNSGNQTINTADIADVSVTQTELAELQTLGSTSISSTNWTALSNLTGTNSGDNTVCTSGAATTATQVYINTDDSGDTSCQIPFIIDTGGAFRALYEDSGLLYNNTSNYITANLTGNVTGDVTGNADTATTTNAVSAPAIRDATEATVATGDYFLFGDVNDSDAIRKDTIQGILDLAGGGGSGTITAGSIHEVAYYSGNGTTLAGDPGLLYEAVGNTLTGTAQWTTTSMVLSGTGGLEIDVANGDPVIIFDTQGADKFTMGVDDSDADSFKIDSGGSLALVSDFRMDSSGNVMIKGELNAASLDISGNVDVDGTLETDAFSINGTSVTSTAAELNILDGVTSTAAELNILDGVTSTTAELNILDGVTSTTAELNLIDGGTARGTVAVDSGDGFLHNDGGVMRMTNISALADRLAGTNLSASDGVMSFIGSGGDNWDDPVDADILPDGQTGRNLGGLHNEFETLWLAQTGGLENAGTLTQTGISTFGSDIECASAAAATLGTPSVRWGHAYCTGYSSWDGETQRLGATNTSFNFSTFANTVSMKFKNGIVYYLDIGLSDEAVKENIQTIIPSGLDLITQIPIKTWNWKEDFAIATEQDASELQKGILAQDAQSISADYAIEVPDPRDEDETLLQLSPAFSKDFYLGLIQSVKELKTMNDALEARIAALEAA